MTRYLSDKSPKFFILIGLLISISFSLFITSKYDNNYLTKNNDKIDHYLIKGDVEDYFNQAFNFKNDLKHKSFFHSGSEYTTSYLYPKIIAFFFIVTDKEIKIKDDSARDNNGYIFNLNNNKFFLLLFQSLLYYFSIFFFYKKIQKKINHKILNILILILCIEPTIVQWNSSFMTESIFLSLLLFLISLLISANTSKINNLFIGLLIGTMYAQRTVSIFLIGPIILYYVFYFKNIKIIIKNTFFIIVGQAIIIIFIGYNNYIRADIFYFTPWQAKIAGYYYASHEIEARGKKISPAIVFVDKRKKEEKWKKENNIQQNVEKDRHKLYDYKKEYFLQIIKKYPLETFKYFSYKTAQTLILDPTNIYNMINFDITIPKYWKSDGHNELIIRVVYSLIIYIICFFGFVHSFKNLDRPLIVLFASIVIYFSVMLGWMGVSRYSVPILFCLGIFFANGIVYLQIIRK